MVSIENLKILKYQKCPKKTLVLSIISKKCKMKMKKNQLRYQKSLVYLKMNKYSDNMFEENISQEFRLKHIDKTGSYFLEETEEIKLMSKKHKKGYTNLNYVEHFFILSSAVAGCILISAFASLLGIPIGITSSA